MQQEPEIVFRGMKPSKALENQILEKIEKLEQFHSRITSCTVILDAPHKHSEKGKIYSVTIDLNVPGREIAVSREAGLNQAHADIHVAVRDAFRETRRLLEDYVRKMSGHRTRPSAIPINGEIDRLFPDDGFGFITTADGQDVYFSYDRVSNGSAADLQVGTKVRLTMEDGDNGPYAHSVTLL